MRTKFTRVVAGAAVAVASVGLFASTAGAANPGTPPVAAIIVTPPTGTSANTFTAVPPAPSFCPGDAVAGYRLNSFVTPVSNDPATLVYNSNGPIGTNTYPLVDQFGTPFVAQNPGLGDGLVTGVPAFSWAPFAGAGLPAGNYFIGIACTLATPAGVTNTVTYFSSTVTLGVDGATYAFVTPPNDVPEVPLNVLLPISAAVILGAGFLVARKRHSHAQVSA
jgi:hypothetical protein